MKKRKSSVMLNWILGFLLLCSVLINVVQLQKPAESPMIGTFVYPYESVDAIYLVIEQNNQFMLYRQFEILEVGIYMKLGDGIYYLQSQTSGFSAQMLYRDSDFIYLFSEEGLILDFYRISDIPSYINVSPIEVGD